MPRDLFSSVPDQGAAPTSGPRDLFAEGPAKSPLDTLGSGIDAVRGRLPETIADYHGGTSFWDRMALSMSDNDKERRLYLENKYGPGQVIQDPGGRFLVKKGHKWVAADGGSWLGGMAADMAGHHAEIGGMILGGGAGLEFGGLGAIPGALIGAAGGAVAGKQVTELEKTLLGFEKKSLPEYAGATARAAGEGAIGEAGGRAASWLLGGLLKGGWIPRWYLGTTDETRRLTQLAIDKGMRPPIRSALPSAKITQFHQALASKATGDMLDTHNAPLVAKELENILRSSGMPEDEIPDALIQIMSKDEAPSATAVGTSVKQATSAVHKGLEDQVTQMGRQAQAELDAALSKLKVQARAVRDTGAETLGQDVAGDIVNARQNFSTIVSKMYGRLDDIVGDQKVVPTNILRDYAKVLVKKSPSSSSNAIVRDLLKLKKNISFSDMQRIRTRLFELSQGTDLAGSGLIRHDLQVLQKKADASFGAARLGDAPEAARMLRAADAVYKDGIRKFHDVAVNRLVAGMETGVYPDASKIASTLFQRGQSDRVSTVFDMLSPSLRDRVRGTYFNDLLAKAIDPLTNEVKGTALNKLVSNPQEFALIREAFGEATANDLKSFARALAARDGAIESSALNPGRLTDSIRASEQAQKALDAFLDDNYLSELAKPSMAPELVYQHLVKPGRETELEKAINFFGPHSQQVEEIQRTALLNLMHKAIGDIPSGAGKTIDAGSLDRALSSFTHKQQELLFPGGLSDDLKLLAKLSKFLFPAKEGDMAAGLAAGTIKSEAGRLVLLPYIYAYFWNWLLSRPATVQWIALGLRQRGPVRKATENMLLYAWRAAAAGMLGDTNEVQEPNE